MHESCTAVLATKETSAMAVLPKSGTGFRGGSYPKPGKKPGRIPDFLTSYESEPDLAQQSDPWIQVRIWRMQANCAIPAPKIRRGQARVHYTGQ